ncbi:MAG: aldehyde dehydrogenase family protein, partial [Pseudomonadales bacterium]
MTSSYKTSSEVNQRLAQTQALLIDGKWLAASNGDSSEVYNPSTGAVITTAASASSEDTEAAIAAARRSFDNGDWT